MAENLQNDNADIKETDIVFDCPHCGKSLAIDYHGAGLNITCTDCGKLVEVPIPDGMDINDFDNSEEQQEIVVINLRKSLSVAEQRIRELESEIASLNLRREQLEKIRADNMFRFGSILEKTDVIKKSIDDLSEIVKKAPDGAKE